MKLYKFQNKALLQVEGHQFLSPELDSWHGLINRNDLYEYLLTVKDNWTEVEESFVSEDSTIDPPVGDDQEVWAAGVTYQRSKEARMEESEEAGGAVFYDLVYDADRPELFFKAMGYRVRGHQESIHIRNDSKWDVPEPELTLFITSSEKIVAYTIGNDVSSRSIEGENPLYLPQAKVYDGSAAIGPCLWIPSSPISLDSQIKIRILRAETILYSDQVQISQMKRSHEELARFLFHSYTLDRGAFLMTGTCLVPDNDFTLEENDVVRISIDHIGTLINHVKKLNK